MSIGSAHTGKAIDRFQRLRQHKRQLSHNSNYSLFVLSYRIRSWLIWRSRATLYATHDASKRWGKYDEHDTQHYGFDVPERVDQGKVQLLTAP
jgi:hypothetical protein